MIVGDHPVRGSLAISDPVWSNLNSICGDGTTYFSVSGSITGVQVCPSFDSAAASLVYEVAISWSVPKFGTK